VDTPPVKQGNLMEKGRRHQLLTQCLNFKFQNSKRIHSAGGILIENGKYETFYPSEGLNVFFSRDGPKPTGIRTTTTARLNPKQYSISPPLS
jgi:hypothetical protein